MASAKPSTFNTFALTFDFIILTTSPFVTSFITITSTFNTSTFAYSVTSALATLACNTPVLGTSVSTNPAFSTWSGRSLSRS
ncbi:hypothetical protein M378DRAFT_167583 [Amanita muscaria Koide BX008]|uniref:Uncharacterized protein n=1 Tax=Amanita muscaria (strain Koide BX008) TaxID=946122 RepID=A0A0C2T330_AMAMK|nr:hypothetical protein M378DRAFT_167583 [Amanita muscaria Koide BX008]